MSEAIKKLYYTISEVCEMTDLKQYVLRYWETEFDVLKPLKNRSGNRIYTDEDIDHVRHIKQLLYEDKYTIEGAKKRMAGESPAPLETSLDASAEAKEFVKEIKKEIRTIIKEL